MRRRWATKRSTAFAAPRLERSPATTTEVSRTIRRILTSHRMSYIMEYFHWARSSLPDGQELRPELSSGESFQGAEACVEFGGRQATLTVEHAQKIRGRTLALARVAFEAARNQVAVGVASVAHPWHNVVEAPHVSGSAAKAVKAGAAFALVNGFAELPGFHEVRGFEPRCTRPYRDPSGLHRVNGPRRQVRAVLARADSLDLLGQAHLDEMAGFVPFKHAQSPQLIEPAH